jgi:hypothetical protein
MANPHMVEDFGMRTTDGCRCIITIITIIPTVTARGMT